MSPSTTPETSLDNILKIKANTICHYFTNQNSMELPFILEVQYNISGWIKRSALIPPGQTHRMKWKRGHKEKKALGGIEANFESF